MTIKQNEHYQKKRVNITVKIIFCHYQLIRNSFLLIINYIIVDPKMTSAIHVILY